MKLLYSYILLFCFNTWASQIYIYYPSMKEFKAANELSLIFVNDYNIPQGLITLKKRYNCISSDKRFLEVCIKKNLEMKILGNKNQEEIVKSLLIFSKTNEVSYDY